MRFSLAERDFDYLHGYQVWSLRPTGQGTGLRNLESAFESLGDHQVRCSRGVRPSPQPCHGWGTLHARYSFPTVEMVQWITGVIAGRRAIEIGSGNGDLGYHLGIQQTDNYCQQRVDVAHIYRVMRQTPTSPRPDVENIDAEAAVRKYSPQVVIGSYITQKAYPGDPVGTGNIYGPDEDTILAQVECYIHLGNEATHAVKRINRHPHVELRFDWLVTKSARPEGNIVNVWGR